MATKFPIVNPFRFQKASETIDYVNNMPRFDLMRLGEEYQRGIYPNEYAKADFKINKELSFIIQTDYFLYVNTIVDAVIVKPDGTTDSISGVKITPAAWVGDPYYKYSYTPTQDGVYQISLIGYVSDFIDVSDAVSLKNLVEVEFYDRQNRNGGYWFDETTQQWSPIAYYTGQIIPQQPENEISIFEDDGGILTKTRSVPKRVAQLRITEVHYTYLDVINFQMQCSNVFANGVKYTAQDIAPDPKEKSDLIDITIKLTQAEDENDYLLT